MVEEEEEEEEEEEDDLDDDLAVLGARDLVEHLFDEQGEVEVGHGHVGQRRLLGQQVAVDQQAAGRLLQNVPDLVVEALGHAPQAALDAPSVVRAQSIIRSSEKKLVN